MSYVRLGQILILILRGRVWRLILARESPRHLFLLFLFTLLLFLALFESLWSTTRHWLLLSGSKKGHRAACCIQVTGPQKG
jgi:4-amino-4-deoxy-L-arabinose transferase-like glycosyltransferase